MDIKVGEYGRTNKGNIFIYANVVDEKGNKLDYIMKLVDGRPIKYYLSKDEQIVKHSFNIIDLIEVGDFINGNRVYKITSACVYCVGKAVQNKLTINIETILTHEQYQANCYTVKSSTIN